ncbi:MAG: M10 family metallopeptidase C-terminal domain-containing protein [Phyllobacterium sp.]
MEDIGNYIKDTKEHWDKKTLTFSLTGFTEDFAKATRVAFDNWAKITNLTFEEVFNEPADITFDINDEIEGGGGTVTTEIDGIITSASIRMKRNYPAENGTYGLMALMHEIGHALGLKHGGPYNMRGNWEDNAIFENDTIQYTIMSYFYQDKYNNQSPLNPWTPMVSDIFAIQALYGVNKTVNSGDTTWGHSASPDALPFDERACFTIVDPSGHDIFDASNTWAHQWIDLRPGKFSSVAYRAGNIGIALGTIIEDARGGSGDDQITGNDVDNELRGGLGKNVMDGGEGNDTVSYEDTTGAVAADLGQGSGSWTSYTGMTGQDKLISIENIRGSGYDDRLTGDANDNLLLGGGGKNTLDGGKGSDTASYETATADVVASLLSATGSWSWNTDTYVSIENLRGSDHGDKLTGDNHDNVLSGGLGNNSLDGGKGKDTAGYATAASDVVADLLEGSGRAVGIADTLVAIENIAGSAHDDTLRGDDEDNVLSGSAGKNTLDGRLGTDTVSYATALGKVFADLAKATGHWEGPDASADDQLISIENMLGSAFADTLVGNERNNRLYGADGDDLLAGGSGLNLLDGGEGSDTASYADAAGNVIANLADRTVKWNDSNSTNADTLRSIENVIGSAFDDTLTGNSGDNLFAGGAGRNGINGGKGADTVSYESASGGVNLNLVHGQASWTGKGGIATDSLTDIENAVGSAQADTLVGDASANRLNGGNGDDILSGGAGRNYLDGGAGTDRATYAGARGDVSVDLDQNTASWKGHNAAAQDTLASIEIVDGSNFDDLMIGDAGKNTFTGGAGDDTIEGRGGADVLTGGKGADRFVFADILDSSRIQPDMDTLVDFSQAEGDLVDLSAIDANENIRGNQAFTLSSNYYFSSLAGELLTGMSGGLNLIAGDVNGDGLGDFAIRLAGTTKLTTADFIQ